MYYCQSDEQGGCSSQHPLLCEFIVSECVNSNLALLFVFRMRLITMSYWLLLVQLESLVTLQPQLEVRSTHTHTHTPNMPTCTHTHTHTHTHRSTIQHRSHSHLLCCTQLLARVLWCCVWSVPLQASWCIIRWWGDHHCSVQDLLQTRLSLWSPGAGGLLWNRVIVLCSVWSIANTVDPH